MCVCVYVCVLETSSQCVKQPNSEGHDLQGLLNLQSRTDVSLTGTYWLTMK